MLRLIKISIRLSAQCSVNHSEIWNLYSGFYRLKEMKFFPTARNWKGDRREERNQCWKYWQVGPCLFCLPLYHTTHHHHTFVLVCLPWWEIWKKKITGFPPFFYVHSLVICAVWIVKLSEHSTLTLIQFRKGRVQSKKKMCKFSQ